MVGGEQVFMTNQKSAELTEPGVGSLHDPAAFVAPHFASIVVAFPLLVLAIGRDQLDSPLLQPRAQRMGVVSGIGDHPPWLLSRTAVRARDADFFECGFRKRSFSRRCTFKPNSQRKTLTVDQCHPLRSRAALGFTSREAPFLAGAKLPSRNVSSHRSNPSPSKAPSSVRQASSQAPCSSHCLDRRQHVAGEGYCSDRKRQAVRSTTPGESLPGSTGSGPRDNTDHSGGVWAQATAARSAITARP